MIKIPIEENKEYILKIEDIGDSGEGIGRIDGFTIFIEDGIPEDKVLVKIIKLKKTFGIGKIIKIIEKSKYRVHPICPVAVECGGCQIQEIDYNKQIEIKKSKVKASIDRIAKLENVIIHDTLGMIEPIRYRNKAQFPIGKLKERSILGFYKKGTHEIVDIGGCQIQHIINDKILDIIKMLINKNKISVYNEKTGKGLLRHILTRVSYATGDLMVVIITNGLKLPFSNEIISTLTKEIPNIKSIVQNINTRKTNVILGDQCITLYGQDKIIDYIGDLMFEISPLSFFQVNSFQTKILYDKVLEYAKLSGNETVLDIYCGIGTISLFLAERANKVYGIEIIEAAIKDAKKNANLNSLNNAKFFVGKAEEIVPNLYKQGLRADVVVVDPPRKGCDRVVLETIANIKPNRVVYVSCKPSTLARDLKILDELGYKIIEIQPVDMFPHTTHVETVTKLVLK